MDVLGLFCEFAECAGSDVVIFYSYQMQALDTLTALWVLSWITLVCNNSTQQFARQITKHLTRLNDLKQMCAAKLN